MAFDTVELWGYFGGGLLAICFIPQVYKIVETRSADDISYSWMALYITGLIFLFVYMVKINGVAGWICMIVEILLACTVVTLKFIFSFDVLPVVHDKEGGKDIESSKEQLNHDKCETIANTPINYSNSFSIDIDESREY